MMINDINTIIFDFGGVIIDIRRFFDCSDEINRKILMNYDIDIELKELNNARRSILPLVGESWGKRPFPGFVSSLLLNELGIDIDFQICKKMDEDFSTEFINFVKLNNQVKEILEFTNDNGLSVGLLSTYDKISTFGILDKFNLIKYFNVILTIEDTGEGKYDGSAYKLIMELLNSNPTQTIMVGDKEKEDILWPNKLGLITVLIGESSDVANYCIIDLSELKTIMLRGS